MTPRGRPRAFNKEDALEKAMMIFWDRGFEGASLDDLTAAMQISPSSLYSAFGSKEQLFFAALDRYLAERGAYQNPILEQAGVPAREAFRRLYATAAFELLRTDQPQGCMLAIAGTHCGPGAQKIRAGLAERRAMSLAVYQSRLERAQRDGDIPPDVDVRALAHYLMTVFQGLSVQARDGASRQTLLSIGRTAMEAWPVYESAEAPEPAMSGTGGSGS